MGEDVIEVARIVRRRGQNLECAQKITVLLRPQDLQGATEITVEVLLKNKAIASGIVPLRRVLSDSRYSELVNLAATDGAAGATTSTESVELDIEFRLFAVVE